MIHAMLEDATNQIKLRVAPFAVNTRAWRTRMRVRKDPTEPIGRNSEATAEPRRRFGFKVPKSVVVRAVMMEAAAQESRNMP